MRSEVSPADWSKLRKLAVEEAGHRCEICGTGGRLECHEVWEYDGDARVQRLSGFVALCDWCHHVKHLVHAAGLASEGKLDYERVVEHFMRVNGCDRRTFEEHRERALEAYRWRSAEEWRVGPGEYVRLVSGLPPRPR